MPASVFQPAVIRAMINACASLKLAVPAAVLCQMLLPSPDFPTAFTLLKTTPAARLDVDYFEFLWEVSQVKCGDSRVVPMEQSPNCSLGKVFDPLNER